MLKPITTFRGSYYFLSNFFPIDINIRLEFHCFLTLEDRFSDFIFKSAEALYQSFKSINFSTREKFQDYDAKKAKKEGRKVEARTGFEDRKLEIMHFVVSAKFSEPELYQNLKNTGDLEIIENNSWNDTFWGVCNGEGQNHMGKILTRVRKGDILKTISLLEGNYTY